MCLQYCHCLVPVAFTLEGLGPSATVALEASFPPAQYLCKVKGCGAEESHQQILISVALSHLEIIEENL